MSGELALVFFTVLSQLAVGAFFTLWLFEMTGKRISMATGKLLSISITIIVGISILISLLHLGHPLRAFMALSNLETSWLSREVAMFSLFLFVTFIQWFQWKDQLGARRKLIGALGSVIGVISVVFSGLLYTLPAIPSWNNFAPIFSFLMTAAILGPVFVSIVLLWKKEIEVSDISVWTIAALIVSALSYVVYLTANNGGLLEQQMTASHILNNGAFWLRAVIGWAIPIVLLGYYRYKRKSVALQGWVVIFLMLLAAELLARELFYSAVVGLQIGL